MAGSVASSASSSSTSSSNESGSRKPTRRASRNGSNVNVQATANPTAVPGASSNSQLEPPISNRSPQSHRRRRRRNTVTTRRASVMVDHDDEISISHEVVDTARTATIESNSPVASAARRNSAFYQLQVPIHQNLSSTSVDSTGLLDHREQRYTRPRRSSTMGLGEISKPHRHHTIAGIPTSNRPVSPGKRHFHNHPHGYFQDYTQPPEDLTPELRRGPTGDYLSDTEEAPDTTTPLLARTPAGGELQYHATERNSLFTSRPPRAASVSSRSSGNSRKRKPQHLAVLNLAYGSVNFPPSVPSSPTLQPYSSGIDESISPGTRGAGRLNSGIEDHVINIDGGLAQPSDPFLDSTPPTPPPGITRQRTGMGEAEEDVCFPVSDRLTDGMGTPTRPGENGSIRHGRRRRPREWPDLGVFEQWSREEKEERTTAEGIRARQVSEPVYVGGRLRPTMKGWHREVEDLPYRFTYFNDELGATIHAQTISELVTPGETTFRDLFMPPPRRVSSSSDEESDCEDDPECLIDVGCGKESDKGTATPRGGFGRVSGSVRGSEDLSALDGMGTANNSGNFGVPFRQAPTKESQFTNATSAAPGAAVSGEEGERPTWWLDVLSPTKAEMKVFQDAFGIHPLTAEDILMQEPREKVELFRNYYLVSYRTFEQDPTDEDYMEPVNFYIVVFRTGVLTFHFSMTPHGANVRRRIRQLKDYIDITADWISYALIDNITDAFGPIIQMIEEECDEIDDVILAEVETSSTKPKSPTPSLDQGRNSKLNSILRRPSTAARSDVSTNVEQPDDASMLRRIATCRKKVMGLYRLMGNKADVIKGFSKRCNEQWDVAPRSEIGLYLGDIQDHIVTMVANLVHVEKILSRGHSNYLAQISIKMNERQEETADTLGRLTVLGTIVLPMNIVTGLWGMNVLVPGQGDEDHLMWFWGITAGLLMFGILCYFLAKRVYGIV
ncbi:CorA metal ion transporter [Orbilia oligospora]|uniref:CorA metal ion transporter n=1 Tax=Orbilia oligospora TaxID=2813651 RepID=A0A6G1MPT6_ORBOL|nr:CorA metal ion transporter [Orbilia oligospora]KAF3221544.1 CorA metal ion transporter [Orbilia oligospora]KAF3265534.1 CorA metal ion transporter [Orbilia oligospora]